MGLVFLPLSTQFSHQYTLNIYCTLGRADVGDSIVNTVNRATHFLVSSEFTIFWVEDRLWRSGDMYQRERKERTIPSEFLDKTEPWNTYLGSQGTTMRGLQGSGGSIRPYLGQGQSSLWPGWGRHAPSGPAGLRHGKFSAERGREGNRMNRGMTVQVNVANDIFL